jgi:hypothetical protein
MAAVRLFIPVIVACRPHSLTHLSLWKREIQSPTEESELDRSGNVAAGIGDDRGAAQRVMQNIVQRRPLTLGDQLASQVVISRDDAGCEVFLIVPIDVNGRLAAFRLLDPVAIAVIDITRRHAVHGYRDH